MIDWSEWVHSGIMVMIHSDKEQWDKFFVSVFFKGDASLKHSQQNRTTLYTKEKKAIQLNGCNTKG